MDRLWNREVVRRGCDVWVRVGVGMEKCRDAYREAFRRVKGAFAE
mgnify:CR=1 FL=1